MRANRKMLVTSALPYANGPIHMGHLVEYIQTDIWVRFQRLIGNDCTYVCASDAHGTPIMLSARKDGVSPEELVSRYHEEHAHDLGGFMVEFDNFHTTHSDENRELVEQIFTRLDDGGLIARRTIEQAYDKQEGMFLPDRFVRGTCPACGAEDQAPIRRVISSIRSQSYPAQRRFKRNPNITFSASANSRARCESG
jgi:methionyl-tRNA synthetase